jgi:hypothetical protein
VDKLEKEGISYVNMLQTYESFGMPGKVLLK